MNPQYCVYCFNNSWCVMEEALLIDWFSATRILYIPLPSHPLVVIVESNICHLLSRPQLQMNSFTFLTFIPNTCGITHLLWALWLTSTIIINMTKMVAVAMLHFGIRKARNVTSNRLVSRRRNAPSACGNNIDRPTNQSRGRRRYCYY